MWDQVKIRKRYVCKVILFLVDDLKGFIVIFKAKKVIGALITHITNIYLIIGRI